ncbi:hypothetical protein [Sporomusa sp.]|uniref:hypothetical protein n=1 Tax=Sporomusa sp. TaxID=2078658 RepID=UPI002B82F5F9|nr:hypothetical protein [Sporomusa sp.]HWR42555.1 hypothetical protein [Sporomusa sp.]
MPLTSGFYYAKFRGWGIDWGVIRYKAAFDLQGNRLASYHTDIHTYIPPEAIEISEEDQNLYATNDYIRDMTTGKPVEKPAYVPTTEDKIIAIRRQRDKLLTESDWTDTLSAKSRLGDDLYNA